MAIKKEPIDFVEMFNSGFKALIICVCGLIVYSYQELNSTMKELTSVTRAIELRVTAIEVDRNGNKEGYKTLQQDVQNIKLDVSQMAIRIQTIADFMAKRVK